MEKKAKLDGFRKIRRYFEGLSTSRALQRTYSSYSEGIAEKTESISRRISGIVGKLTQRSRIQKEIKEKEEKMLVPKLKISKIIMKDPKKKKEFIIENRCKELLDDMNDINESEVKRKVIKGWKKFIFFRKEKKLKIISLQKIRFLRFSKNFFMKTWAWVKEKQLLKAKKQVALSFLAVNYLRKGMIALHSFKVKQIERKSLITRKFQIFQTKIFKAWKIFIRNFNEKREKILKSRHFYESKQLGKYFKSLKVRAKEIQLSKNQDELVRVFREDKLLRSTFDLLKKGCALLSRIRKSSEKAETLYNKKLSLNFLQILKAGCLLSLKHHHIKTLSFLHFSSKNKQKFLSKLKSQVEARHELESQIQKAEEFRFDRLTRKPLLNWFLFTQNNQTNQVENYKSFLIHCKSLIEKAFYGWKKQFPKERYKRLRTLRLQNKIEWNIVDSLFCDWLKLTVQRVQFSNSLVKKKKLKVLKKYFLGLKSFYLKKREKNDFRWEKIQKIMIKKQKKYFQALKSYFFMRMKKNLEKTNAVHVYIGKIFKKWNKLGKIKAYLKYLSSYHYAKYLFQRWKNYSYSVIKLNYAQEHHELKLMKKTLLFFKQTLLKAKDLEVKLNSYLYYKDLKVAGACLDKWLVSLSSLSN
jgi:hypothetical protein